MNLLLDTHVLIWALATPEKLTSIGRDVIASGSNTIYASAVSIWEIAIKYPLGKTSDPPFSAATALDLCAEAGFVFLSVTPVHAVAVEVLPPLHRDPFDRLLVAQGRSESMLLLTRDTKVLAYGGEIMRV